MYIKRPADVYVVNVPFVCTQTSFGKAMRSKAKLSLTGEPEREPTAVIF